MILAFLYENISLFKKYFIDIEADLLSVLLFGISFAALVH
ncbi:MAG: hypothetical protein Pg6B_05850 [Candidatus Azobacteroides pseudotrichonymphae]|jgi:hypothetical protein|nr:MAG: hypothetical protein Pg6B_05850 [Candidatus Azobacteroides pseudotrichonymphae]